MDNQTDSDYQRNPNNLYKKLGDGTVLELEIDLVKIRYCFLEENGSKPKDKNTLYVSRLMTLLDLKD